MPEFKGCVRRRDIALALKYILVYTHNMFFEKVFQALAEHRVNYAVAGGVAVALHGATRGTVDIDIALAFDEKNFERAEQALKALGLASRLPISASEVYRFRQEYLKNRNLIAWSFVNPDNPSEIVDLLMTHDLKKMKTKTLSFQGRKIPLLALEDLIKMKTGTGRRQDEEDVKALQWIKERQ